MLLSVVDESEPLFCAAWEDSVLVRGFDADLLFSESEDFELVPCPDWEEVESFPALDVPSPDSFFSSDEFCLLLPDEL